MITHYNVTVARTHVSGVKIAEPAAIVTTVIGGTNAEQNAAISQDVNSTLVRPASQYNVSIQACGTVMSAPRCGPASPILQIHTPDEGQSKCVT